MLSQITYETHAIILLPSSTPKIRSSHSTREGRTVVTENKIMHDLYLQSKKLKRRRNKSKGYKYFFMKKVYLHLKHC